MSGRTVNIETAPGDGAFSFTELSSSDDPWFHANGYKALSGTPQNETESSSHRLARGLQLLTNDTTRPSDANDLLRILGDTADVDGSGNFPIWRSSCTATSGEEREDKDEDAATLVTVLFNLGSPNGRSHQATATFYEGNPVDGRVVLEMPILR